jgi:hypothetical protein
MALFKTTEIKKVVEDDELLHDESAEDFVICKSPEKLQILIKAIEKGNAVHYLSRGDWSMHDLVMQLLKKYKPATVFITTYALRELGVRQLLMAQEAGDIKSVNMVLDYRAQVRTPEVYQLASNNFNKIALETIHAKVTVIKSAAGCVSIVGSANWTSNPKIEAGVVSTNEAVANFHMDWIKKLIDNAEVFK